MSKFIDKIENKAGEQYELKHSYTDENGNIELTSAGAGKKLNLVSDSDIQIKPGNDGVIQLDKENDTTNSNEVEIEMCNGSYEKAKRVVGTKINTAEIIIDNQNCNTDKYSTGEIHIKARHDKKSNPVYVKAHARAWDIRCEDHGGIALQPAGEDGEGKENKIKFESDRITPITENGKYSGEGGTGLEFGTFNTEKTSIFTNEYRFNTKGKIIPSVRKEYYKAADGKYYIQKTVGEETNFVEVTFEAGYEGQEGIHMHEIIPTHKETTLTIVKADYLTQSDDFKDSLDETFKHDTHPLDVRWEDIVYLIHKLQQKVSIDDISTGLKNMYTQRNPQVASLSEIDEADNNEQ